MYGVYSYMLPFLISEHFPNIQSDQMSVSGISAGAAVATQFHVAYSEYMRGSGTFAGGKYHM